MSYWISASVLLFALVSCGDDAGMDAASGAWIEADIETRGSTCATFGSDRCLVLTADETVVVDVSGPVTRSMVEVGPTPVELCWCQCTCAPGMYLGEFVVTRSDGAVVTVDLGSAGMGCCETM